MGERLTAVPFLEERIDPDGHEYAEVRQEVDEDGRGKTEVEHYPEHVHPEEPREGEPKETLIRVAIAELTVGRNDRRTNDPSIAVHQDVLKVVQREEVGEGNSPGGRKLYRLKPDGQDKPYAPSPGGCARS